LSVPSKQARGHLRVTGGFSWHHHRTVTLQRRTTDRLASAACPFAHHAQKPAVIVFFDTVTRFSNAEKKRGCRVHRWVATDDLLSGVET